MPSTYPAVSPQVAWNAVKCATRPRVHTFLATSKIHMEYKLRMSEDEVVAAAVKAVSHLRDLGCEDIEFSPEDAGRCDSALQGSVLSRVNDCCDEHDLNGL